MKIAVRFAPWTVGLPEFHSRSSRPYIHPIAQAARMNSPTTTR